MATTIFAAFIRRSATSKAEDYIDFGLQKLLQSSCNKFYLPHGIGGTAVWAATGLAFFRPSLPYKKPWIFLAFDGLDMKARSSFSPLLLPSKVRALSINPNRSELRTHQVALAFSILLFSCCFSHSFVAKRHLHFESAWCGQPQSCD